MSFQFFEDQATTTRSGDLLFDVSIFKEEVDDLVQQRTAEVPVQDVIGDDLCPLDVADAGYVLEDRGLLPDADTVFSLPIGELHTLLLALAA